MARSDNQNLQIFLIVFVILTLVLAVTTFMFFRSYSDASTQLKAAQEQAAKDAQQARTTQQDINKAMELIGVPIETKVSDLETKLNDPEKGDKKLLMASVPADKQSYRRALEHIVQGTLQETLGALDEEKAKVADLTNKALMREQEVAKQVQQFQEQLAAAKKDLASEQAKFSDERARLNKEKESLASALQAKQAEMTEFASEKAKEIEGFNEQNRLLTLRNTELTDQIGSLTNETFEVADGQVRNVAFDSKAVWINLGSKDSLRPQVTFSVYGHEANDVARQAAKAKIEVTRILGPSLAEARIVEDDPKNPITSGDLIYTPLWHPGRNERFALAGFMDLDGDDLSDRPFVRDLIAAAGGIIDAEVADDGKTSGEMSIQTRYLVLGDEEEKINQAMSDLKLEARTLGVETITLEKFLDHVGWKDPKRVWRFGETPGSQFTPDRVDGGTRTSTGTETELYRSPKLPKVVPLRGDKPAEAEKPATDKPAPEPAAPAAPAPR
jgi:hypothetical protein